MGLTFQMSPILTQAERATWAEALVPLRKPKKPVWLELRIVREKVQELKLQRRGEAEHADLIGHVKILALCLGNGKPFVNVMTRGSMSDVFFHSTLAACGEWLGGRSWNMETSSEGPILLFCFLAWSRQKFVFLVTETPKHYLASFSFFSPQRISAGSLCLLCSSWFLWSQKGAMPSTPSHPAEAIMEATAAASGCGSEFWAHQPFSSFGFFTCVKGAFTFSLLEEKILDREGKRVQLLVLHCQKPSFRGTASLDHTLWIEQPRIEPLLLSPPRGRWAWKWVSWEVAF